MYKQINLWKGAKHHILIETDDINYKNQFGVVLEIHNKDSKGIRDIYLIFAFARHELKIGLADKQFITI